MAPTKATRLVRSARPVNSAKSPTSVKSKIRKPELWKLRLYVAGQSPKSIRAFANLKILCEQHLKGRYRIEVVDLLENPQMARGGQIIALPALVVKLPQVVRQIIGDLSNTDRVLIGLALQKVVA
jgi:circadian clock protein KaiB